MRLSWLAADLGPRLAELDINPLILRAAGQGAPIHFINPKPGAIP